MTVSRVPEVQLADELRSVLALIAQSSPEAKKSILRKLVSFSWELPPLRELAALTNES